MDQSRVGLCVVITFFGALFMGGSIVFLGMGYLWAATIGLAIAVTHLLIARGLWLKLTGRMPPAGD